MEVLGGRVRRPTRTIFMALLLAAGVFLCAGSEVEAALSPKEMEVELDALRAELDAMELDVGVQEGQISEAATARSLQQGASFVTKTEFDVEVDSMNGAMDSAWLLLCGALVMIMHAGFALLETGSCRVKNAQNVLMKNLVNVCVGTFGWYLFGWAFAYGGPLNDEGKLTDKFIGSRQFASGDFVTHGDGSVDALNGRNTSLALSWFFQWAFCTAGATIVSGGVAERVKSPSYAVFAFVMAAFIYPVVAAWTWGYGWLSGIFDVGFMDFAGSGVVHLTGGISALAGTVVLGPRKGRWEHPEEFEPHSLPLVVLGTFILWFGWYGFNPGSTLQMHTKEAGALAAVVAMNSTLAAATGGISVFALRYAMTKKYDVGALCNGILAGLVSITAGCANVECGSAIAISFIGAFIYQGASMLLVKLKIDDPVDAVPVHGACGAWGTLAVALFDWGSGFDQYHGWNGFNCMTNKDGTCMKNVGGTAIGAQLVMILVIVLWAGSLSSLTFFILKVTKCLRIDDDTEQMGLDAKQHSPPKAYTLEVLAPQTPRS